MPSFLWQGNLPNRASKIKRLFARHDIHLPRTAQKNFISQNYAHPTLAFVRVMLNTFIFHRPSAHLTLADDRILCT
jgi:hypothetical protein